MHPQSQTDVSSRLIRNSANGDGFDANGGCVAFLVALDMGELDNMDRNHLERCHEMGTTERETSAKANYVSLETEIPEVLYRGMKDFIGENPTWDQYRVMSSALAHFLFQNGSDDRAVTERYLDDLFIRPDH